MPINIHISGDSPDEVLSLMAGLVGGSRTTAPASPIRTVSDEHKHVPAAGEVEAEEPAEGVELDAHGHPWNEETYASTKTKTGEGLWRLKPGQSRPDPMPGYPLPTDAAPSAAAESSAPSEAAEASPPANSAGNDASVAEDGAAEESQSAGDAGTENATDADTSSGDASEDDEFAAFAQAKAESDAAASSAGEGPAREWDDADLSALLNQAALKLGGPEKIKEAIAEFVPEGAVAHSRHIPVERREEFAQRIEKLADIEFAG